MAQRGKTIPKTQVNHNENQSPPRVLSSDELFDRLVSEEENIALMIDIVSPAGPSRSHLVGSKSYETNDGYQAALRHRITRLSNGGRGDDRLRWDSEKITVFTQPDPPKSSKNVCCISAAVPITAGARCQCGEKDYKCREHRKIFRVVFTFNPMPTPHAPRTAFHCRNRHVDETLDQALEHDDWRAWGRARGVARRFIWPRDDMDLRWLWLRVSRGFTSAAENSFAMEWTASQS